MSEPQRQFALQSLDDQPGPARRISDARARELVRGALRRVIAGEGEARPRRPTPARRFGRVALVAGGLLAAGAAVAGLGYSGLGTGIEHKAAAPAPIPTSISTNGTTAQAPERALDPTAAPEAEAPAGLPATAPALDDNSDDGRPAARLPARRRATPAQPRALLHADGETTAGAAPVDDLLSRANQLRGQRRWREAAAAYQAVIARSSGSDSAYVAMMARAELLLDHLGRPAEALGLFQRALAQPSGVLTEEAHYGIAACYRALGDIENERLALNVFLAAHPHSLMRTSAAGRLAELH